MAAMDRGMRGSQHETPWQVDFQALDRRERLIIKRMLAGLALGMILAVVGETLAEVLPAEITAAYDPYVYGLLVLVMTRGSAHVGWATLNGLLAAAGLTAGHVVAHALNHEETLLASTSENWPIALSITMAAFGVVGYLSRRRGLSGDVAVGLFSGLLFTRGAENVQQAALTPHIGSQPGGPWMLTALVVMGFAFPLLLRPTARARSRTLLVTLGCAALFTALSLMRTL
ncbi:hypothetical protein [Streptosporangium carneum]|uniref:Uncharacterized protein n=1 Tax=Streptosporangium carneum TaxID=47481 RepID=A0A9W6I0P8_9ACTN|nr:hypothetical protein [Streptosporangium carneum]GLK09826.1 hypothetical protein GCM10017600_32320 [Streptosporangium carneum]